VTPVGPWPIRIAWLLQPIALAPAMGAALDGADRPVQVLVAVMAWLAWTGGVVAVLVPRALGLTAIRILAPAGLGVAIWSALTVDDMAPGVLAVSVAAVGAVAALSPTTGDVFVNGSAYGAERRFALRPPAPVILGPVQVVWVLVVAGAIAGPLLLADSRWIAGGIATAVGAPVAAIGARSLHQLSRRWLVMVPAGIVVHDPAAVNSQLVKRSAIASMGPAPADTGALDLTAGALGLAIEVQLREAGTFELRKRRAPRPTVVHATAVMFTPSRPGAVLREAAARSLPVR
jgi:hypothetical protein